MGKNRKYMFVFILVGLENIILLACFIAALFIADKIITKPISDFDAEMEKNGRQTIDTRGREPYVMFRPRSCLPAESEIVERKNRKTDWNSIFSLLHKGTGDGAEALRQKIRERISPDIMDIVKRTVQNDLPINEETRALVRQEFNRIILETETLYNKEDVKGIRFLGLMEEIVKETTPSIDTATMNRKLFEYAFPGLQTANFHSTLGFHSPEISLQKDKNEYRIAMLGGSVVYCGSSYEWTAPGQLSTVLRENADTINDRTVTYINAGMPSGVSGQELAQFIWHVLPLDIDLLVVFDGFNDFYCPLNGYDRRIGYPPDYFVEEYRFYRFNQGYTPASALLSLAFQKEKVSNPITLLDRYYKEQNIYKPELDNILQGTIKNYFRNINNIVTLANANNIPVAVFLQPYSDKYNPLDRPTNKILIELYAKASEEFRKLEEQNSSQVIYYDLTKLKPELEPLFVDPAHYKQNPGNRIVADEMYKVMKQYGMLSHHSQLSDNSGNNRIVEHGIPTADNIHEREGKVDDMIIPTSSSAISPPLTPVLSGNIAHYNIVYYNGDYFGVPRSLGALDLSKESDRGKKEICTAKTKEELQRLIIKRIIGQVQ